MKVSDIVAASTKEWKYGALLRPVSTVTLPKGFIRLEAHPDFKHGVAVYDHKLSDREAEHFDLVLFVPESEILNKITDEFKEYASTYVEDFSDDMPYFESMVGQAYDELKVHPEKGKFDRKKTAIEVMNRLRKM